MYYKINPNTNYEINGDLKIKRVDGKECTLDVQKDSIAIDLYGYIKVVKLKWLYLIAKYGVSLPNDLQSHIFGIQFKKIASHPRYFPGGYMVMTEKPLEITNNNIKYRILPAYSNYAISNSGSLLKLSSGRIRHMSEQAKTKNDYPRINLYSHVNGASITQPIHRLVAFAWCVNDDYDKNPIVNHIDGNKYNLLYTNLKWCTYRDNNLHAALTGLRNDTKPITCKYHETGEVKTFSTISEFFRYVDVVKYTTHIIKNYPIGKTIKGWEIRLAGDNRPWADEVNIIPNNNKLNKSYVLVTDNDVEYRFNSVKQLERTYCKTVGKKTQPDFKTVINKVLKENPHITITLHQNIKSGPYEAMEVTTGKITERRTTRELAKALGVPNGTIVGSLSRGETYVVNGYVYRYKTDVPWNTDFQIRTNRSKCIEATNSKTNKIITFKSLRTASSYFKVSRAVIKRVLEQNKMLYDFNLKYKTILPAMGVNL